MNALESETLVCTSLIFLREPNAASSFRAVNLRTTRVLFWREHKRQARPDDGDARGEECGGNQDWNAETQSCGEAAGIRVTEFLETGLPEMEECIGDRADDTEENANQVMTKNQHDWVREDRRQTNQTEAREGIRRQCEASNDAVPAEQELPRPTHTLER
jgi:hypothetical protein